jgi:hypothetical protein
MISLAITTYNRSDLVVESFLSVLNNEYINEIVIVDDFSDMSIFDDLKLKLDELQNDKIKLYRNDSNLKPLLNKLETIKHCQNEWVILLDSDNKITNDYIDIIKNLDKDENVLYLPQTLLHFNDEKIIDFYNIKNCFINFENIKDYLNKPEIDTVLNVGNFFVNKNKYLQTFSKIDLEFHLGTNDAFYFSYLWIMSNKVINVVSDLKYYHRQHDGSWYLNNRSQCDNNTKELINKLKNI